LGEQASNMLKALPPSASLGNEMRKVGITEVRVMRKIGVSLVDPTKKIFDFIPMERCSMCMTHGPMNTLRKVLDLIMAKAQDLDNADDDTLRRTFAIITGLAARGIDCVGLSAAEGSKKHRTLEYNSTNALVAKQMLDARSEFWKPFHDTPELQKVIRKVLNSYAKYFELVMKDEIQVHSQPASEKQNIYGIKDPWALNKQFLLAKCVKHLSVQKPAGHSTTNSCKPSVTIMSHHTYGCKGNIPTSNKCKDTH
jgi:hypothetical protein